MKPGQLVLRKKILKIRRWKYIDRSAFWMAWLLIMIFTSSSYEAKSRDNKYGIVASDTILSGMISLLLPPDRYSLETILPPGQCPGHYDVKLSDIEKMTRADLIVTFRGLPFMQDQDGSKEERRLSIDAEGRNWMAPDAYRHGLQILTDALSKKFTPWQAEISKRKEAALQHVREQSEMLLKRIKDADCYGKPLIASSMLQEPLEWMGFRVIATYGRQESISAKELARIISIGKDQNAGLVVDNLQSGPDTGRGIAEALGIPHVVLSNFPSEKGYLVTLEENVDILLAGSKGRWKSR